MPELNLWLGIWQGERLSITTHWLRWWDETGQLLLWEAEKFDQERQRADQERQARIAASSRLLGMGLRVEQIADVLSLSIAEVNQINQD